jgi:hypothetical protein
MKKRFPRKAKKWAKRAGVDLISVSGKRMWYSRLLFRFPTPFFITGTKNPTSNPN